MLTTVYTFPNSEALGAFPRGTLIQGKDGALYGTTTGGGGHNAGTVFRLDLSPKDKLGNISTRGFVQTGDNVLIGGFIITGTQPKRVIVRALGPSLTQFGVKGALADPILALHKPDGTAITNDNWKDTQQAEIQATTLSPPNDLDSAIVATLAPGAYTAIVKGKNNSTGVALVEAYDLDQSVATRLTNISTRGFVSSGDNVMIGGFIVKGANAIVALRAIGPTLGSFGVVNPQADPNLELHNGNGAIISSNDNWKVSPDAQTFVDLSLALTHDTESIILAHLAPGNYTAIVKSVNGGTGVALVECYDVD